MRDAALWSVDADAARLECGRFAAVLRVAEPAAGLRALSLGAVPIEAQLLAFGAPLPEPQEGYARGRDYVTTHAATERFPFRTQLGWSARALGDASGEVYAAVLTLSLQTDLLDTRPTMDLVTTVMGSQPTLTARGGLFALPEGGSLLVAPYPSDLPECTLRIVGGGVTVTVAPPFLEKGVIRRLRFAAVLLPGADDDASSRVLERLDLEPLPLTA